MNAFNYIIDKREPSDHYKNILDSILQEEEQESSSSTKEIPLPHNIDGFLILDALSQKECDDIIAACEGVGFTFWSNPASGDEEKNDETKKADCDDKEEEKTSSKNNNNNNTSSDDEDSKQQGGKFRTAHTIEVNLPRMSSIL